MPVIWPFAAIADTSESLEWRTELLSAKAKEQRIATRTAPRRSVALNHVLTVQQYTAARALIRANESFYVPYWPQAIRVGAIAAGSNVVVSFTTANLDFVAGGNAILWESASKYEYVSISALTANNVTIATVVNTYTSSMIIPTFEAFTREGLTIERNRSNNQQASIAFSGFADSDIASSAFAQYRGHDLMSIGFAVDAGGSLQDMISWPLSEIDNDIGRPVPIRSRTIPDEVFTARWHVFTRADTYTLRRWIYSRYGRQRAFWASSRMQDFVPAATISAIGTTLTVFAPSGVTSLGRTVFDIEVRTINGTLYQRQVTNVAVGSPVNGLPTLNLTISSAFGVQLTTADFDRISYLRCLRFNADRIELLHRRDRGMVASVPCMEIDVPV